MNTVEDRLFHFEEFSKCLSGGSQHSNSGEPAHIERYEAIASRDGLTQSERAKRCSQAGEVAFTKLLLMPRPLKQLLAWKHIPRGDDVDETQSIYGSSKQAGSPEHSPKSAAIDARLERLLGWLSKMDQPLDPERNVQDVFVSDSSRPQSEGGRMVYHSR
ncbi:hypothetical protein BDV23DRAFT_183164 [Aspergillus alliaceus]|uniref:Uncharacterized protein n=1 Tax=Petromyces alliaceus TaxID=209559 RepID=A0A5N7C9N8_PETAA|nr:hypothetical protein BDV23DRAFT_183164 [Aspergillus alliaceus]